MDGVEGVAGVGAGDDVGVEGICRGEGVGEGERGEILGEGGLEEAASASAVILLRTTLTSKTVIKLNTYFRNVSRRNWR